MSVMNRVHISLTAQSWKQSMSLISLLLLLSFFFPVLMYLSYPCCCLLFVRILFQCLTNKRHCSLECLQNCDKQNNPLKHGGLGIRSLHTVTTCVICEGFTESQMFLHGFNLRTCLSQHQNPFQLTFPGGVSGVSSTLHTGTPVVGVNREQTGRRRRSSVAILSLHSPASGLQQPSPPKQRMLFLLEHNYF